MASLMNSRVLVQSGDQSLGATVLNGLQNAPVLLAKVPALADEPDADRRRVIEAHLLERETADECDARQAVGALTEKNEAPQG